MAKSTHIGRWLRGTHGLAFDEALVIGGMVGSLAVMGAVSVSWGDVYTGTFAKHETLLTEISTISDANARFHERFQLWPHQTTNGDWAANAAALADKSAMRFPYNNMLSTAVVLPSAKTDPRSRALVHTIGEGGRILQREVTANGSRYLEIIFENIPVDIAKQVDEKIDGSYTPTTGDVSLEVTGKSNKNVNLHYLANRIL